MLAKLCILLEEFTPVVGKKHDINVIFFLVVGSVAFFKATETALANKP